MHSAWLSVHQTVKANTKLLQSRWSGCRTGNGKKLSSSHAQLGQATYLAVASFLSVSCATSTLYINFTPIGHL